MEEPEDFPFYTSKAYKKVRDELESVESSIKNYEEFLGTITSEFRSQNMGRGNAKVNPSKLLEEEPPNDSIIQTNLKVNRALGSKDVRVISNRCRRQIDELREDREQLLSDLDYFENAYNHFIEILASYRNPGVKPIRRDLTGETPNYVNTENPVLDDFEWLNENMELSRYIESVL